MIERKQSSASFFDGSVKAEVDLFGLLIVMEGA
jgi:hypothetical protein